MKQCIIEIRDEVNCRILNLDLATRRSLVSKFKFIIPSARYLPAVRLGRWDGKVAFVQLSGSTYINLLPDIIPFLVEEGYDIELNDLRTYSNKFEFDELREDSFADRTWPKGHVLEGQKIYFRDYQIDIINRFLTNTQCIQEVATGAGKTVMTAALSHSVEGFGRSIVIVPNKSLVTQTEADYVNVGLDVGVYFGDRKEFGRQHTICTWQSLNNLLKNSQNGTSDITISDFVEDVVCVIVDEVHMASADVLRNLLTGIFARVPIRWGLTGTIPKEEYQQVSLRSSLGEVIGRLSAAELQEEGHLAKCHVNIVQLVDYVEFKDYQQELKYLLNTDERLDFLAKTIAKIAEGGNTLVLVDRVEPGKKLAAKIPDAVFISGGTKAKDRKEEYDEFQTSDSKITVATYGIAAVGINIPRIFNLVILEPGKSFVRVIQSIGRGIRKADDKDFVQIWDLTSTCKFAKRHLTKRKQFYNESQYPFTIEKIEWK